MSTARLATQSWESISERYSESVANTRSTAAAESDPEASTPSPSRVTVERRTSSETPPAGETSATSSRVELVPMSTTATRVMGGDARWIRGGGRAGAVHGGSRPGRRFFARTRDSDAGWSSLVARRAHNPKVAGSNPAPAMKKGPGNRGLFSWKGSPLAPPVVPISYQFVGSSLSKATSSGRSTPGAEVVASDMHGAQRQPPEAALGFNLGSNVPVRLLCRVRSSNPSAASRARWRAGAEGSGGVWHGRAFFAGRDAGRAALALEVCLDS